MDASAVAKQLDHMVKFIYREADEKAAEISAKAQEEFAIEKGRIVQEEKLKLAEEYDRKKKQVDVQKRIERSNQLNQSRLSVLGAREKALQELLQYTHSKLSTYSSDHPAEYKELLAKLIAEGVFKVDSDDVHVICRKEDLSMVEAAISAAADQVAAKRGKRPTITVEQQGFLPPSNKGDGLPFCSGGVLVSAMQGKILCSNTLDARLAQAYENMTPELRMKIYGPRQSGTAEVSTGDLLG